jgi:hypothetical protein
MKSMIFTKHSISDDIVAVAVAGAGGKDGYGFQVEKGGKHGRLE